MAANNYYLEVKNKSPLTIEGRPKELKEKTVRISLNGGEIRKEMFYQLALGHAETFLLVQRHFGQMATKYTFDTDDKYTYWFDIMVGDLAAQDLWHNIIDGVARTDNNFKAARKELLGTFIQPNDYQYFLQYLTLYRKPTTMKAQSLGARLTTILGYAAELPGGEVWDVERKKRQFNLMFPLEHQHVFERAHGTTTNVTWIQLMAFYRTFDSSVTNLAQGNKKKRNLEAARIRGGDNKNKKTHKDKNMCRIHAELLGSRNHTWHNCIYNRNGPKFNAEKYERRQQERQQDRNRNGNNSSGGSNTQSTPTRQSYHQERCPATGRTSNEPPLGVVRYQNGANETPSTTSNNSHGRDSRSNE